MGSAVSPEAHLRRVLDIHFDPESGAPYWIERQRALGFDPRREIHFVDELMKLGPMDDDVLRARSVLDFVPKSQRHRLTGAVIAETGGMTGEPKRTLFSREEFDAAFIAPFVATATAAGFPRGAIWLWVGPSGPHVIGRAAAACAAALDSPQPFAIDFDPRWFRKLPADSAGRQRYLDHLIGQAMTVIRQEPVGVLFTTPVMLRALARMMSDAQRQHIRGVHYGGMRVERELLRDAQQHWFPKAVHLAGYGNSLFGVCMEMGGTADRVLRYFPHGPRYLVRVDESSRVWMSRLDPTVLIANLPERDIASRAQPAPDAATMGFGPGVEDPRPHVEATVPLDVGIY